MDKKILVVIATALFLTQKETVCFSSLSDEWVRKAMGAATQAVQGNPQGVLYGAVPYSNTKLANSTYLNAGLSGVSLDQGIPPLNGLNSKYLGFGANYHVADNFNWNNPFNVSQYGQLSARNPFFTNTTTFTPKLGRRQY